MINKKVGGSSLLMLPFSLISGLTFAESLPFKPTPSGTIAKDTIAESIYKTAKTPERLPKNAPNILVILMDDAGPGTPSTYGGMINTPNLSRVAKQGISFNQFHSTAMSSPTRASLLTGRNHTRVGSGQITEWANNFPGFDGIIPKSSAMIPEVLKDYGYSTAAFGKWHNTPTLETSQVGPYERWPTGYGFQHFYGFLAGESNQYEPTLVHNTTYVNKLPKTAEEGYHLTDDITDNAIHWLRQQHTMDPNKPVFMYWAPGAIHGPHQVPKQWADKYKGKFDKGWDHYREVVFERQKKLGFVPKNAKLTPRPDDLASWDSIPENEKPFQRRLMEVVAGFGEHADYHAGRLLDEFERLGIDDNTLVFYIWGDNGSSAEGLEGTVSELLAQNGIPSKIPEHINVLNKDLGGLEALGGTKTDNMYHAGWAWAGATPFKGTKLLGAYFGGTRQPMAVSWPDKIKHDNKMRSQFHHVNDIAPTIYDVLKIPAPESVNGIKQDPIDGVSMAYTFNNAKAPAQKKTQFFDIMASRAIYHDGWIASTFGPRIPWVAVTPGLAQWTPEKDKWELYNLNEDFTQANDLSQKYPEKLKEMQKLFMEESRQNKNLPIGGGLYVLLHPEAIRATKHTKFSLPGDTSLMREVVAPRIGTVPNKMVFDVDIPKNPEGVLIALGGYAGGMSVYVDKNGLINYEYNMFEIERTKLKGKTKLPEGKAKVEVVLKKGSEPSKRGKNLSTGDVTILVNGKEEIKATIPTLITAAFTANDTLDVGQDLGSPVSQAYFNQAPYKFNGKIQKVDINYLNP